MFLKPLHLADLCCTSFQKEKMTWRYLIFKNPNKLFVRVTGKCLVNLIMLPTRSPSLSLFIALSGQVAWVAASFLRQLSLACFLDVSALIDYAISLESNIHVCSFACIRGKLRFTVVCSVYCQRSQGIGRKCQCHWHFTPISLSIQSQCWQDSPWLSFQHLTQGTWYFQVEFITFCFQRVAAAGCPLHSSFCEAEKTMLFPVPQVDLFFFSSKIEELGTAKCASWASCIHFSPILKLPKSKCKNSFWKTWAFHLSTYGHFPP